MTAKRDPGDIEGVPCGAIGRFVTLGVLGHGGMGMVLSAFDPQLDRKVAIKILHPQLSASDAARARLQREALAMARLAHPNVVTVYEVGCIEAQLFIAMELVDGVTLRTWLAQRERAWREILAILLAAGRGLVAAHEVGLVHRDFKPENVLVARDGRVRVTDFGVARLSFTNDAEPAGDCAMEHPLTRAGAIVGTPRYMAPEQRRGEPADERADQFSFCVALWEAMYGACPSSRHVSFPIAGTNASAPFSAAVPVPERAPSSTPSEPAEAAIRAHTAKTVPADAVHTLRRSPAWLRRILERGLADDPAARWPSMT
ncbi:MAG: serine/threonine-protein kinase, partial [bacterium]